jgi:hypothetical protein
MRALFFFFLSALAARAHEVQVPFSQEPPILLLDAALERRVGLFPEYEGFREARLYQVSDSTFALEIHFRLADQILRERLLLSAEKVEELRLLLRGRLASPSVRAVREGNGRRRFLVTTFALSYGFYSWALPVSLDFKGRAGEATGLTVGSAGFFGPFYLSGRTPVSKGMAALSAHGGIVGIVHGLWLGELFFGERDRWRGRLGLSLGTSLGGLTGGLALARRTGWSAGTAEIIGLGGGYGMGMAAGTAELIGLFDGDHRRQVAAMALAGSALGYWGGRAFARRQHFTRGDADALLITALLGGYSGIALMVVADVVDNEKAFTAAAMAGGTLGVVAGERRGRGRDFSTGDARLIGLGALGGALLGGAFTALIDDQNQRLGAALTAAGALSGYALTFSALEAGARTSGLDGTLYFAYIMRSGTPFLSCIYHF